jgi:DNA-binding XRE family transcriptional regulator
MLRERRRKLGKTVAWVAYTIGAPRSTVARVEAGTTNPSWGIVLAISQALGLEPTFVPRERVAAAEAVVHVTDAPEVPPLVGESW